MYDKNSIAAKKYEDFTNELLGVKKASIQDSSLRAAEGSEAISNTETEVASSA
jgi:hypothetical protein